MDDMISRQAAIDRATKEHDFFRGAVTVSDKARRDELLNVMCWLGELPPAQLAKVATDINVGDKDTISRKAAIEEIERWLGYIDDDMVRRMQIGMKRLPPTQPEHIRGHWIEHDDGLTACECSVCHEKYNLYEEDVFGRSFCPNCGADMREVTT